MSNHAENSDSGERRKPLVHWKKQVLNDYSTIIVAGGILLVCVAVGLALWSVSSEQGETEEEPWNVEALQMLRGHQASWGKEEVADWEEKKTYPLEFTLPYALYEMPRFDPGKQVFKVGDEYLYTDDFNQSIFVHHYAVFTSVEEIPDAVLDETIEKLKAESILLQEAADRGYIELDEAVFNSSDKDYERRGLLVASAEQALQSNLVSEVAGETIAIWFYSVDPPDIGVEAAKEIAYAKMNALRDLVVAGDLTFEEAGRAIADDPELRAFDVGIDANSYSTFRMYGDFMPFTDPNIGEAVEQLSEGSISEILTGKDKAEDWYDAYFTLVKVDRVQEGIDNFETWLANRANQYVVKVAE